MNTCHDEVNARFDARMQQIRDDDSYTDEKKNTLIDGLEMIRMGITKMRLGDPTPEVDRLVERLEQVLGVR